MTILDASYCPHAEGVFTARPPLEGGYRSQRRWEYWILDKNKNYEKILPGTTDPDY